MIALDIDEDERRWYRGEAGILDEAPLPEVRFAAVTGAEDGSGPADGAGYRRAESEQDCDDVWANWPVDTYWTEDQQAGAHPLDSWGGHSDTEAGDWDADDYGIDSGGSGALDQDDGFYHADDYTISAF